MILWPISLPFFCKKHPIWGKLGAFLAKFSKIHPIFVNWAHWVCDDNPPIDIPKLMKMYLKAFEYPRIPFVSENPHPRDVTFWQSQIYTFHIRVWSFEIVKHCTKLACALAQKIYYGLPKTTILGSILSNYSPPPPRSKLFFLPSSKLDEYRHSYLRLSDSTPLSKNP